MDFDFYKILDVPVHANPGMIKRAFQQKAKLLHPDVNPSQDAADQFIRLRQAYETLSDPDKRKRYDFDRRRMHRQTIREEAFRRYQQANNRTRGRQRRRQPSEMEEDEMEDDRPGVSYKENPFLYNSLFLFGIVSGSVMVYIGIRLFFITEGVQQIACFCLIPGLVFIHDGWTGLTWNGRDGILTRGFKKMRNFFRVDFS